MGRRLENVMAGVVVAGVAALIYLPALNAPFIFDDHLAVQDNRTIRTLWPLDKVLAGPVQSTPLAGRPLVNLSLALNYAAGGLNPWGYHAVNIALHVLSALLLLGIVRRTLSDTPWGKNRQYSPRSARAIAFITALLWAVHPLNSEPVVYVTQRTELLASFFYLLTIYCAARGLERISDRGFGISDLEEKLMTPPGSSSADPKSDPGAPGPNPRFFIVALLACAAGMASKEIMVSAPIAVLLYDRTFVAGSFAAALRRSRKLYLGLALTWLVLAAVLILRPRSQTIGVQLGVTPWRYLLTQSGVLLHYLRLCFWPTGLTIAYDWPVAHSLAQVWPACLVVGALLVLIAWALCRAPAAGFLGAVFFMVLAPSSSIIPVVTEVAAERRMYLPLAAVVALVTAGGWELIKSIVKHTQGVRSFASIATAAALVAAVALSMTTLRRLNDYHSEISIWTVAITSHPSSPTAWSNLGTCLLRAGRTDEAAADYERALQLEPNNFETHNSLGSALLSQGNAGQAIAQLQTALRLAPSFADAWYNLGNAWVRKRNLDQAVDCYKSAIRFDPNNADAWLNLGNVYLLQKQLEPATKAFAAAVRLLPGAAGPLDDLGQALALQYRLREALECFTQAAKIQPDQAIYRNHRDQAQALLIQAATRRAK